MGLFPVWGLYRLPCDTKSGGWLHGSFFSQKHLEPVHARSCSLSSDSWSWNQVLTWRHREPRSLWVDSTCQTATIQPDLKHFEKASKVILMNMVVNSQVFSSQGLLCSLTICVSLLWGTYWTVGCRGLAFHKTFQSFFNGIYIFLPSIMNCHPHIRLF